MTVKELIEKTGFSLVSGEGGLSNEIKGCYIGDLLSLAMSKVREGYVWITIQTNVNIVAVSVLAEGACVILCDGQTPDDTAKNKADMEDVPLIKTEKSAYAVAKDLINLGV
ncbi:MAG: DRTGG domain-containing protein [Clostridia bacterium]|nr:DRTGG domain-containing protein [Clostridia bacterium]